MRCELRFQDPSSEHTVYLYEQIIRELISVDTDRFEGIFAFASRQGVASLLEDPDLRAFLARGGLCTLIVGIDAITDDRTLELLRSLCVVHSPLEVMVFHNDVSDLFHPKVVRFFHANGGQTIIVGSGNLTPGGLRRNIEAYAIAEIAPNEVGQDSYIEGWDDFVTRHAARIRVIDDATIEAARRNRAQRRGPRRREVEPEEELAETEAAAQEALAEEATNGDEVRSDAAAAATLLRGDQRMLIAQVPRAGGRWHQVHFNEAVVEDYFRMQPDSADRAFLYEIRADGEIGPVEVRKCVFSRVNVNRRIEFGAHRSAPYPPDGPPILVLREIAYHTHRYAMLMPGEPGYDAIAPLVETTPIVGRGPTRRAILRASDVLNVWPSCPV